MSLTYRDDITPMLENIARQVGDGRSVLRAMATKAQRAMAAEEHRVVYAWPPKSAPGKPRPKCRSRAEVIAEIRRRAAERKKNASMADAQISGLSDSSLKVPLPPGSASAERQVIARIEKAGQDQLDEILKNAARNP